MRVRIITPIVTRNFVDPADLTAAARPDTELSCVGIDEGPASIESEFDAMLAVPHTVARVMEAEAAGIDAVVINCMDDPGVRPAREVASIPVVGPCETAMHLAAMLAHRFSVVAVLDQLEPQFTNQARLYGVADRLASVRSVEIPVLALDADPERLIHALIDQAVRAVEDDRAHAIVFGCTGMVGAAAAVQDGLAARGIDGVPVIDPLVAAVKMAEMLTDLRLGHSKRTYPRPPGKAIHGYDAVTSLLGAGVS